MITQRGGQRNLEKLPSRRRAALLCVNLVVDKFHWIFGIFLCVSVILPSAPSRCLSLILIPAQHAIWALALAQTRKNWKTFKRVYSSSFGFISFHQSLCWLSRWAQLLCIIFLLLCDIEIWRKRSVWNGVNISKFLKRINSSFLRVPPE